MLLSGFTFIRNALKYDFPFREAAESMLPLVDELVINVGKSEDGTEEFVEKLIAQWRAQGLTVPITVLHSVWDDSKTDSGLVLSEQTNIALSACRGRWALYLQADEALHEMDYDRIREALKKADADRSVEGIRFRYLHFYGGYTLIQRPWNWYPSEIRIIRTGRDILSYGDAQTFRKRDDSKPNTMLIDAHIFHYGHARHPDSMKKKISYFHRFWHGDQHGISVNQAYNLDFHNLVWYWGTHPASYRERIQAADWSPRPAKTSEPFEIVISAETPEMRSLALAILNALSSKDKGLSHRVTIVNDLKGILQSTSSDVPRFWIDLDSKSRPLWKSLLLLPVVRACFQRRMAYVHQGTLSKPQRTLYNEFAWGTHEDAAEGFRVPKERRAELILRTAGFWP